MTTFTLPAPEAAPARPKSRYRKVNYWIEGTEAPTDQGGTQRKAVQVSVGHSKERKEFYASAQVVTIAHEPRYFGYVESFNLFSGVGLGKTPVARFSEKALEAWLGAVLDRFPEQVAGSPKLQAWFTETEEPS